MRRVSVAVSCLMCLSADAWAQDAPTEPDAPRGAEPPPPPRDLPPPPADEPPVEVSPVFVDPDDGDVDMRGAMKRYDYDRGRQLLWGAGGGVIGWGLGVTVLLGGAGLSTVACANAGTGCRSAIGITSNLLFFTTLIATPIVAINLTGGPRANGWTYTGEVVGVFAGLIGMGLLADTLIPSVDASDPDPGLLALNATATILTFAVAGTVGALGYQLLYPGPEPIYVVTPMVLPDGGGLVLGGRF